MRSVSYTNLIRDAAQLCETQYGMKIHVYPVVNECFGPTITVTGLLTGQDIVRALRDKPLGKCLFMSNTMPVSSTHLAGWQRVSPFAA